MDAHPLCTAPDATARHGPQDVSVFEDSSAGVSLAVHSFLYR